MKRDYVRMEGPLNSSIILSSKQLTIIKGLNVPTTEAKSFRESLAYWKLAFSTNSCNTWIKGWDYFRQTAQYIQRPHETSHNTNSELIYCQEV